MSRFLSFAKIAGLIALMSLMLLGAELPGATASTELSTTTIDCEGFGTCMYRVMPDGTIIAYELGKPLL